jgi:hypothetical protein
MYRILGIAIMCSWITQGWAVAIHGDASFPFGGPHPLGELHHAPSTTCPSLLRQHVLGEGLGDLRAFASDPNSVFFKAAFPRGGESPGELEYESEIRAVSDRDEGFQSVVLGLTRRALNDGWEQEAGALSFVDGDERTTVYFSSRTSDRILARHHRRAMERFFAKIDKRVAELREQGVPFERLTIERFHTHPTHVNLPHSGQDVLQDVQFDGWLRRSSLGGMRFRSYVVMLYYSGEVFVEFEPRRHRLF